MSTGSMVFRTVYVDPDVDHALRHQADEVGVSKGEMFRRYLERGMAVAKARGELTKLPGRPVPLTMRTVYLPFRVDESLRGQAFELRTSESDLMRQFLRMGMLALQASVTSSASTKRPTPKSSIADRPAAKKKPAKHP